MFESQVNALIEDDVQFMDVTDHPDLDKDVPTKHKGLVKAAFPQHQV